MKEDILEQVVDDYLQLNGYFTQHNVRYRPSETHPLYERRQHSVFSDIDVIGVNPRMRGIDRVRVVSCKSWQGGFDATRKLSEMNGTAANPAKRATWRHFRDLWDPAWNAAFREKVEHITGARTFRYSIAVTRLKGPTVDPFAAATLWGDDPTILQNLAGSKFTFLEMAEIWEAVQSGLTQTPASSEVGRLAQLLRAARID